MCAIVDNDVRDQVFGSASNPASLFFLDWIDAGKGRLVVGGKLLEELSGAEKCRTWLQQALLKGTAKRISDEKISAETNVLMSRIDCRSNDVHVLALARAGGARLLFTNDSRLRDDFKDPKIIDGPRGQIYSTRIRQNITNTHRKLLRETICPE